MAISKPHHHQHLSPDTASGDDETDRNEHGEPGLADVVIVGGGAAGLSAALTLSRVRRSVVVIDAAEPRNEPAAHIHGYLTRDGVAPKEFLALGRTEVEGYGALVIDGRAVSASTDDNGRFVVTIDDGRVVRGRRLLVTTGLVDQLPSIDGLAPRWGRDVLHCPYCHGWEVRDQAIAVISTGAMGVHQALMFRQVSAKVTLFVHTGTPPTTEERAQLASRGITLVDETVTQVVVEDDHITGVRTASGLVHDADAVVVMPRLVSRSAILASLGLEPVEHPRGIGTVIESDLSGSTAAPGVWVAGNVTDPAAGVVQSASAGTTAAAAINADLVTEDTDMATAAAGETIPTVMDETFWDQRYRSAPEMWSGNPNPHLIAHATGLAPGRVLDIGAGEGGNAIWLAEQGWEVTAVDISAVALERGRNQAAVLGEPIAQRITWVHADATEWEPPAATFDLVTLQFVHLASAQRRPLYRRCARAVTPGGTLLIVDHHPSDSAGGPRSPDLSFTPVELAGDLDGDWNVVAGEARPRTTTDPQGETLTAHDTVLVARRHPLPSAAGPNPRP